jgi:hypothetical protein
MKRQPRRTSVKKGRSKPSLSEGHLIRRSIATPRSEREANARERALAVLANMRRKHVSLATASRLEHIKPTTVRRYVGSAVRQDKPGGRFRATKGDRFRRDLQIPSENGPITVPIYGSKNGENISKYLNAVAHYLRTGDQARLRPFKGKALKVGGKRIKLLTDPRALLRLAEADLLHFDQLYASVPRR